jgi:hypothetical protein
MRLIGDFWSGRFSDQTCDQPVMTVAGAPRGLPALLVRPLDVVVEVTASSLNDGQRCWENITTVSHVGIEVL